MKESTSEENHSSRYFNRLKAKSLLKTKNKQKNCISSRLQPSLNLTRQISLSTRTTISIGVTFKILDKNSPLESSKNFLSLSETIYLTVKKLNSL